MSGQGAAVTWDLGGLTASELRPRPPEPASAFPGRTLKPEKVPARIAGSSLGCTSESSGELKKKKSRRLSPDARDYFNFRR